MREEDKDPAEQDFQNRDCVGSEIWQPHHSHGYKYINVRTYQEKMYKCGHIIDIYIYIYMCVCICTCICMYIYAQFMCVIIYL